MSKNIFWLIGIMLMINSAVCFANDTVQDESKQALAAYIAEPENIDQPWVLNSVLNSVLNNKQYDDTRNVTIETYTLHSQYWPKTNMSAHGTLWQHELVIYQPDTITTNQALLFVNGGTRNTHPLDANPARHQIDLTRIAAETHSIVIDLQDIPNQYLSFDDHVLRKEDSIVAYTWNRYMDNPDSGNYWPLHLPMTKAVIKAMDAAQQIMLQKRQIQIEHFVVAGLSKRGLATWLAALSDERINAIIPIVIDMLNVKDNLNLIYTSYHNSWPPALHSYVEENIPARLTSPEFEKLMNIEDPLNYLTGENAEFYKNRLSIPKYIISASGDDFFVPGSLNLYLKQLPGETRIRVAPNQAHYIDMKVVEDSILPYYQMIINHTLRPTLKWKLNKLGAIKRVTTNKQPASVKLWEAENPEARDFRLASHINFHATELTGTCEKDRCRYPVSINRPLKGWKAYFVEVTFDEVDSVPLVLTTSSYVLMAD